MSFETVVKLDEASDQQIKCSLLDQILCRSPIGGCIFFPEKIPQDLLIESLKKTLIDFPYMAGNFKWKGTDLFLNHTNKGIKFSSVQSDKTMWQDIESLKYSQHEIVDMVNPIKFFAVNDFICKIKVTYYKCGGMSTGISLLHSLGDMHSIMLFIDAWSKVAQGKPHFNAFTPSDRRTYQKNHYPIIKTDLRIRYLNLLQRLTQPFYLAYQAFKNKVVSIYFSESELKAMKATYLKKSQQEWLSTNDVLCAHVFSKLRRLDPSKKRLQLTLAVNDRDILNLKPNLFGNYVGGISPLCTEPLADEKLADIIRYQMNHYQPSFHTDEDLIRKKGEHKLVRRFVSNGLDPRNKNLLMTNVSKFPVETADFGISAPCFFTPIVLKYFRWSSMIINGFNGKGVLYRIALPKHIAKRLLELENLAHLHQYRSPDEQLPDEITKLSWIA